MQVFVIHGGTSAFKTYEDFLDSLRNKIVYIDKFKNYRSWKERLGEVLGDTYEVVAPSMPNKENARYEEWKIWFEKFIPFMNENIVLVGHSLGAIFLAKYLSEETLPKKIVATFLVAPPFNIGGSGKFQRKMSEFSLPPSLQKFIEQGGDIHIYHSKDDPVVPFTELAKYQAQLPQAHVHVFEDRQHFNQETFPEIVEDIKKL